jgi:hypothetical protein
MTLKEWNDLEIGSIIYTMRGRKRIVEKIQGNLSGKKRIGLMSVIPSRGYVFYRAAERVSFKLSFD